MNAVACRHSPTPNATAAASRQPRAIPEAGPDPDRAGERRHDPRQDAPADRDHRDVDQREAQQRAVAQHLPVAARDRFGTHLLSHGGDEDRRIDEVGRGVGEEEHHEAVEAEPGDDASDRRAHAHAHVDRDARDGIRALAQLARREGGHQRRLARVQPAGGSPSAALRR
jgi:hypothetical protein